MDVPSISPLEQKVFKVYKIDARSPQMGISEKNTFYHSFLHD